MFSMLASGAALAQTTGSTGPDSTGKDKVPPGGCLPIGVTASGEIVFPFTCKAFIERLRGPNRRGRNLPRGHKLAQFVFRGRRYLKSPQTKPAPAARGYLLIVAG